MFLNIVPKPKKTAIAVLRVRDVEGGEAGAKHGSEADPGTSPTAWVGLWAGKAGTP